MIYRISEVQLRFSSRRSESHLHFIGRNPVHDLAKLFERRYQLDRNEAPFPIQHPIIISLQTAKRIFLQTKCFAQQTLRAVPIQGPDGRFTRNRYSQSMVGLIVWKDKRGDQRAVVTPTVFVNSLELTAMTQASFRHRLVMG